MSTTFYKYQGTGNDFIMIDGRHENIDLPESKIEQLCHRRFGIGADGLIILKNHESYDFEMIYYNSDGKIGSMCGNGGRCTVRFAHDLGVISNQTLFLAADGEHIAFVEPNQIQLKMGKVSQLELKDSFDFMNTGSPHYIKFVENVDELDVFNEGKKIRYSPEWVQRGGANVNFVEKLNDETLKVRTYERGVEDETFSCGTGVTAAAISANIRFGIKTPIKIITKGGNLSVSFDEIEDQKIENIFLIGPAKRVFEGQFI